MNRRVFLARAGALGAAGLAARVAAAAPMAAADSGDYRALVCVFLYGGIDGNNLVVPLDNAGYKRYADVRPPSSDLQLERSAFVPIQPANTHVPYGLHPKLAPLAKLFEQERVAILANVGTLNAPAAKGNLSGARPENLFSHSDQQAQWQSSVAAGASGTGWGGRIADQLPRANGALPVVTSIGNSTIFATGSASTPLELPPTGVLSLHGAANARLDAYRSLLAADHDNAYVAAAAALTANAIAQSQLVEAILASPRSAIAHAFAGNRTPIALQLLRVARLIEARRELGAHRQVFFVSIDGFDTHTNELAVLDTLLAQLAPALAAFHSATVELGVASNVTTFTLSEFGRTFAPASGGGTDHAWGSHMFVMGGAVRGRRMYGKYPVLALGGPDDSDENGRWIPSTSVDQYGATLARWLGLSPRQVAAVFPAVSRFPAANLGFLG